MRHCEHEGKLRVALEKLDTQEKVAAHWLKEYQHEHERAESLRAQLEELTLSQVDPEEVEA